MDVSDLKEFLALAKQKSFIEAAEDCFISQSTLSKHIKRLEKEIGYSLFIRNSTKIKLSEYGKLMLPYAESMVAMDVDLRKCLRDYERKIHETLTIGSTPLMVPYNITGGISGFHRKYPQSSVNITEGETPELIALLEQKKIHLAFIITSRMEEEALDLNAPDIRFHRILYQTDVLSAVLPRSHPLADRTTIPLSLLEEEAFIFFGPNSPMYDRYYSICRSHRLEPNIMLSAPRGQSIVEMVSQNMGVSIMPRLQALSVKNPDVVVIPIDPLEPLHVSLISLKTEKLTDIEQRFAEYIQNFQE